MLQVWNIFLFKTTVPKAFSDFVYISRFSFQKELKNTFDN